MRLSSVLTALASVLTFSAAFPTAALAQEAKPRDVKEVFVRSTDGVEIWAQLVDLQPLSLSLFVEGSRRDVPFDSIDRIQTRGDSVRSGAIIGAIFGAVLGGITVAQGGSDFMPLAIAATIGYGLIGAGVDGLIPGRTTIYSKPSPAASSSGAKRAGMSVKIGF